MPNHEAQGEAWVRKKPKRIIQSQPLIMILICLASISPFALSGIFLWLIFNVYPSVIIPVIVVSWLTASILYIIERLTQKIKSS